MKKKVKDLTFEEKERICKKQTTCAGCPINLGICLKSEYEGFLARLNWEVEVDE